MHAAQGTPQSLVKVKFEWDLCTPLGSVKRASTAWRLWYEYLSPRLWNSEPIFDGICRPNKEVGPSKMCFVSDWR